jgi:hypothetical protein
MLDKIPVDVKDFPERPASFGLMGGAVPRHFWDRFQVRSVG